MNPLDIRVPICTRVTICLVCGYDYIDYFPHGENGDSPSNDICICCGTEFGYQDSSLKAIFTSRAKWIAEGLNWNDLKNQDKKWNPLKQILNIPEHLFDQSLSKETTIRLAKNVWKNPRPQQRNIFN